MKKFMIAVCCAVAFSGCTCEEKNEPAPELEAKPVPAVTKVTPKTLKINPKQLQLSLEAMQKYKKELAEKRAQHEALMQTAGTDATPPAAADASAQADDKGSEGKQVKPAAAKDAPKAEDTSQK